MFNQSHPELKDRSSSSRWWPPDQSSVPWTFPERRWGFHTWTGTKNKEWEKPLQERTTRRIVVIKVNKTFFFCLGFLYCLTSSIFETQIWKSPDVSQTDDFSDYCQDELLFVGPLTSAATLWGELSWDDVIFHLFLLWICWKLHSDRSPELCWRIEQDRLRTDV